MPGRAGSGRWILGLNATLALCVAVAPLPAAPGPVRMLAAGLAVLVLPGVAWLGALRGKRPGPALLTVWVVAISSLATLGALLITSLGPEPPARGLAVAWLVLVINSGVVAAGPPGGLRRDAPWWRLGILALAGFLLTSAAALHLVPPLEDHDMELRGSAWGLAATFKPYYLTNRGLYVQAAHPILFHFHIAESLLLTGEIEATRPSYDSALRARKAASRGDTGPWLDWWRADYEAFVAEPALVGTRAPSCLLSGLSLALLGYALILLTGSWAAVVAAVTLYSLFPETLVRACYAGYFPVTVLVTLAAALLFTGEAGQGPGRRRWLALAGILAALVNHKTVVLVLAVAALAAVEAWMAAWRERRLTPGGIVSRLDGGAVALGAGFGAGTLIWWSYGLAVHAPSFIEDHLRKHIAHRFLLSDLRLGPSTERYAPGMLEVWREFAAHTGVVFVPAAGLAALVLLAWWIRAGFREGAGGAGNGRLRLGALLALWFLVGAVLYTLTDWRQTKHLMNQLAPMVATAVGLAAMLLARALLPAGMSGMEGGRRWPHLLLGGLLAAALLLSFLLGLRADRRLLEDFSSLTISGASDIDGW